MDNLIIVLREIIRIIAIGTELSNRKIAEIVGCSHPTVSSVKRKLHELALNFDVCLNMADKELYTTFYPRLIARPQRKRRPDFEKIAQETKIRPKKRSKVLRLIHREYVEEDPESALSYSQFAALSRAFLKNGDLELKQVYHPGEYMGIDFAGMTLRVIRDDGTLQTLYVFVACLCFSKMMFAFATPSMKSQDWIQGLCRVIDYFGKVPKVILFDNAKAMVRKAGLIAELNSNANDFARYHKCVCDTSRVATPRDNRDAEKSVQFIENQIIVPMRRMTFYSQEELNAFLSKSVDELNEKRMPIHDASRKSLFELEKHELLDCPSQPYQMIIKQGSVKVPANYLISYNGNYYSVPHELRQSGKRVEYIVRPTTIEMYCNGKFVVKHNLSEGKRNIVRLEEHMPSTHVAQMRKNKGHFVEWAEDIGINCVALIESQYDKLSNTQSQYAAKHCSAIQKLAINLDKQYFDKVCRYAVERHMYHPKKIERIISSGIVKESFSTNQPVPVELLQNIRGAEHYVEENHHV